MVLLIVISGLLSILFAILFTIRRRYSYWKNLNIPYVEPEFPFGNLKGVGKTQNIPERIQEVYQTFKGKSPFAGIFLFLNPAVLLLDLDLVKNVLIKDFNYFQDRGVFYNEKDDPVSAHLFAIHGEKWKLLRSKLTPTFTSGKMKFMFPTITEVGKRLEKKIGEIIEIDDEVDIKNMMARYTTDVIGTCAFGITCNSINNENGEFRQMGQKIFDDPRHSAVMELFIQSFKSLAQKLHVKRFRDNVSAFFTKVVQETVALRESQNIHRNDFMDLLITLKNDKNGDPITFNELLAQAFVFFVAGFETSSTLLSFCLYELSVHQDIQEKARNHIKEVIAKHNGELTYEAMMDMKYLDQILNETLRLYPPAATLFRKADHDYKVPGTNYVFKNGTTVVIPAFAIQRDPEIYPNPEEFNPENFSEERCKERPSVAFLPFGEGPRICIGLRFGMMQARIGLVSVLSQYKYELAPRTERPLRISPKNLILSAIGGIWLKVKRINA